MRNFLKDVIGVVEANSFERLCLWREYHQSRGETWEADCNGYGFRVGYVGEAPVWISLNRAKIMGHWVLFVEDTSMIVDHQQIETWLEDNLPMAAFQPESEHHKNMYLNKHDAMNFHNVFHYVEKIHAKPD